MTIPQHEHQRVAAERRGVAQARDTRNRVVAAARALFAQLGYAATTIQAIAAESGVAVPTIYDAFKSERGILEAARLAMLEESQIPGLMAEAHREPDPGRKLDLAARWVRQQMERSYDVIQAFREASRADPDAAADHRRILDRRARSLRGFIATLKPARELVVERGWSPDRFEQWLARTIRAQLLGGQTSSDVASARASMSTRRSTSGGS